MNTLLPRLDPAELRAWASRDWGVVDSKSLAARVQQPVGAKVAMAIALYEAARRTLPGWPTDADRRVDLQHHLDVKAILDRCPDVCRR
jgi:hypothetical protein